MGLIIEDDLKQFIKDLGRGNLGGVLVYVHRLTGNVIDLARDENLSFVFEAIASDAQLDLHFNDADLEIIYSLPKRILMAITNVPEAKDALSENPGLVSILADYDLMRDCVFCANAITDKKLEEALIDVSQNATHLLSILKLEPRGATAMSL